MPFSFLSKQILTAKIKSSTQNKSTSQFLHGLTFYIPIIKKHLPWTSVCLDQAIAVRWMLNRRNTSSKLFFGVMKDKNASNMMKAHAWLMAEEYCVIGHGYEEYHTTIHFRFKGES